jgi:hypothetical protein
MSSKPVETLRGTKGYSGPLPKRLREAVRVAGGKAERRNRKLANGAAFDKDGGRERG